MEEPDEFRDRIGRELDVDPREIVIEEEQSGLEVRPVLEREELEIDPRDNYLEPEDRLSRVERKLDRILELLDE